MKLLIVIFNFLVSVVCLGQQRTNKALPVISTQIIGQLTMAKGWIYNPEGQWVSRPNRIPCYLENESKIILDYENYGLGQDNFIFYQLRRIKVQDSSYYILIKKYKNGDYKYRSISRGWGNYNSCHYYVFKESELSKLSKIKDSSINLVSIGLIANSFFDISNEKTLLNDIEKSVVKSLDNNDKVFNEELIIHLFPVKAKKLIQFQIYGWQSSRQTNYTNPFGIVSELVIKDEKYTKTEIYHEQELFQHCYYETDLLNFSKLFQTFTIEH